MMDALTVILAVTIPLQWNVNYRTDVPYEVELSPAKLERLAGIPVNAAMSVKADGKALATAAFAGKGDGTLGLRFQVPAGTRKLDLETQAGTRQETDSLSLDNLFKDVLKPAAWKADDVKVEAIDRGIRLSSTKEGTGCARFDVSLNRKQDAVKPMPVKLELDVKSVASMTWGGKIMIEQLDEKGNSLPEFVSDARWTSEMFPPDKAVSFREKGAIHPRARTLRMSFQLVAKNHTVDEYGLPRKPGKDAYPQLEITRLALRPAAELPFPKYDAPNFFGDGVSDRAGDRSFKLAADRAFWYQTRGMGSWARGEQYRDERDIYFPVGAGTIEAYFKPDFSSATEREYYLFEGASHTLPIKPNAVEFPGRKSLFALTYCPATKMLRFYRKDMKDKEFAGSAKAELPGGKWSHVACTFVPGDKAVAYIDGKKCLQVSLEGMTPQDLANDPLPNNTDVVGCYIGCNYLTPAGRMAGSGFMTGEVDLWRVSSGVRYNDDFTPAKAFTVDGDTRALFDFDDSFDGVSGGGLGFIGGTCWASSGRRDNRLEIDGRKVQYFPAKILPENDPNVVFDILNYPVMPTDEEMNAARVQRRKTFTMKDGDKVSFTTGERAYADYVEVANEGTETLVFPAVLGKDDVDPRSFGDFAESLNAMGLSDRDKVNRTFSFLLRACDYFISDSATYEPDSNKPGCVMNTALTMINGYCGFECGPLNTMAANMFACSARCPASMTGGYGHSFQQVFFDGKNHIYDLSAQRFFPSFDNETSVYLEEDSAEPGVHARYGGSPSHFIRHGSRTVWPTSPGYRLKVGVSLRPGERFRAWFDNAAEVNDLFCSPRTDKMINGKTRTFYQPYGAYDKETMRDGEKPTMRRLDRFFPQYGNGFIEFEGAPSKFKKAFVDEGASFRYHVESGYPIISGVYEAKRANGKTVAREFSFDGGKKWVEVPEGKVTYPVRARHAYWVRVKAPMKDVVNFKANTIVQLNARVFPGRVKAGTNEFRFKSVSGGAAKVNFAWRENVKRIEFEGAVSTGTIPGAEKTSIVMDPTEGVAKVKVKGASKATKVTASAGLAAKFANGVLEITAKDLKPQVGYVTLSDGEARRSLTVISAPDSRFTVKSAELTKAGDSAAYDFKPLPAGDYMIMSVVRFMSHPKFPLNNCISISLDAEPKSVRNAATAINPLVNYYKAHYGQKGGRANWKWDVVLDQNTNRPYWGPKRFKAKDGLSQITFSSPAKAAPEGGAEVAAVLVVKYPEDAEFRTALEKVLCGLNSCPERVK